MAKMSHDSLQIYNKGSLKSHDNGNKVGYVVVNYMKED